MGSIMGYVSVYTENRKKENLNKILVIPRRLLVLKYLIVVAALVFSIERQRHI